MSPRERWALAWRTVRVVLADEHRAYADAACHDDVRSADWGSILMRRTDAIVLAARASRLVRVFNVRRALGERVLP